MDIQYQPFFYEPINPKARRCGCYLKNYHLIPNVKPNSIVGMPLKHISYDIEVTNGLASITLEQKYLNPTQKFLEIEFSFPIDPKACIYRFVAEFGNKRVEGIVKEKEEAKKEYNEAVKQGKQAVYAEIDPNSKDIMNMEIGNVGPNEEVKISISYLQQLNIEQNTFYQLHLPSTITPRYANNFVGRPFAQNIQIEKGQYTWSFKVALQTSRKLVYYMSSSHELNLVSQNSSQTQTILHLAKQEKPNVDFFLIFTVEDFHLPNYVLGRTDVSSTAMLSFIPKFCELSLDDAMKASMVKKEMQTDINAAKGEYIFLLDRSGSMGGTRIKKACEALTLFLQSLPQDTYFNVISFGSGYNKMFNESIKYDNKNLKTAIKLIDSMSANMGGTEIFEPLQSILQHKTIPGYPKQIFLLTDGGVSNTEGVIALVGRQVKYSRCHSIGIGNGCSEALIKGCAEKGKGKFIFIDDSENPSEKIIGLLEETLTPVIDKVSLKYDKDLVESIVPNPDSLPYILKNEVVNFYLTFKGQLEKKTSVTFGYQDSMNKVPFETVIEVDPDSPSMPFVDKMAHSRIIRNLETAAKDNKPVEEFMYYVKVVDKKKKAIDQSVKHQILSEYTAFICVSKELVDGKYEEIKDKGTDKVKIQPMLPEGYSQEVLQRGQRMYDIMKKTSTLASYSDAFRSAPMQKMALRSAPIKAASKKSSGGFFSGVVQSISNGISGMFSSTNQQKMMNCKMMAPRSSMQTSTLASNKEKLQEMSKRRQLRQKISPVQQKKKCKIMNDQQDEQDFQAAICEAVKCESKQSEDRCVQKDKKKKKKVEKKSQSSEEENKVTSKSTRIEDVVKEQDVDGSFSSQKLFSLLYPNNFKEIAEQAQAKNISVVIYITYLISKWIQKNHPQKQYALIVKKAYSYIKKSTKLEDLTFFDAFVN